MPIITTFDEWPPMTQVKTYTVTVRITTAHRVRHKTVSGLTNDHATARQIADDTAQAIAAVYCGAASVQCGPVEFGQVVMGHMPECGFYVDGRRLSSLSISE